MTADAFLTIDRDTISWGQALRYLEASEQLGQFIGSVVRQHLLEQELANRPELSVSAAAIEAAIGELQQEQQLSDPALFEQWLAENGLDTESLRERIAFKLKVEQLKLQVTQPKLQAYFIERKLSLDRVVLSRIVVKNQELAEELRSQIAEGAAFEQLAREYSVTDDRWLNGMMGAVSRGELSDFVRSQIDSAAPGDLIEPLPVDNGWTLFRVEAFLPATFEQPDVQEQLHHELFEQWLAQKMARAEIQLQVSD
jgi:hypothetical protein